MTTIFGYLAFASLAAFLITKFAFKRDEGFYFLVLWGIFATLNRALSHEWILASISVALLAIVVIGITGTLQKKSKK